MEQMYSLKSAAKLLAVSVRTVRRLLHEHQIRVYRVGGNIRLKESDLKQLVVQEKTLDDYGLSV
jgi:excisionase family DNA binding protein